MVSAFVLADNFNLKQDDKSYTLTEYNKKISNKEKMVLVYFYADWCMVCPKLKPILDQIANEYQLKTEVLKIDIDKSKEVRDEFEIDALPVLILYKEGKNIWTHVGLTDKKTIQYTIEAY